MEISTGSIADAEYKRLGVHSVQITRLHQKSPEGLGRFMKALRGNGIGTIYFRVFQNHGDAFFSVLPCEAEIGIYFKSSYAPLVSDLLPLVCRIAHSQGIKVYAWMNTLKATFLIRGHTLARVGRFDPASGKIVRTKRLSPFDPGVVAGLSGLFSDLARNPIDGILVQDDLTFHYNEDVSPLARRAFERDTGKRILHPRQLYLFERDGKRVRLKGYRGDFWKWSVWKSHRLALFLNYLIQAAKKVRPSIRVALNINYEALLAPENALAWYSRDIPTLEKFAHPDRYMVMSYQRQMEKELGKPEAVVLQYLNNMVKTAVTLISDPERWVFKIQTIDWKTRQPIDVERIKLVMASIKSAAPVRICLMPYEPFLTRSRDQKVGSEPSPNVMFVRLNTSRN